MKIKKYVLGGIALVALAVGVQINQPTAHALKASWKTDHWITLRKKVRVIKMHNSYPLSDSFEVAAYTAKKGYHYKLYHWSTNYSWVFNSGHFNSGSKYTYMVDKTWNSSSWFRVGIH